MSKYELLKQKDIVKILDGDITYGSLKVENDDEKSMQFKNLNIEIKMPYLSGPTICDIANDFGSDVIYNNPNNSREGYMYDLFDAAINSNSIPQLLKRLFSRSNFQANYLQLNDLSIKDFNYVHKTCLKNIIERINIILEVDHVRLSDKGELLSLNSNDALNVLSPALNEISVYNVKHVYKRLFEDYNNRLYDNALNDAGRLIEIVIKYVLQEANIEYNDCEDIVQLYKKVKDRYHLRANKKLDERIRKLLGNLEQIIKNIRELRSKNGAHGTLRETYKIEDYHARLAINSTISLCDFLLSVAQKALNKELK